MIRLLLVVSLGATCVQAAFPGATSKLIIDLTDCEPAAQSDINCLDSVRSGVASAQKFIQDVHDVRTKLQSLQSGLSTLKSVLTVVKIVPAIGSAVTAFQKTVDTISGPIDVAYKKVSAIDDKLWPYNDRLQKLLDSIDKASAALAKVKQQCGVGHSYAVRVRDCLLAAPAGNVRDRLGETFDSFCGLVYPTISNANQAMTTLSNTCNNIRSFARLPWPDVGFIRDGVNAVLNALHPILDALNKVKDALSQRVCLPIPSPDEIIAKAKEIAKKLNPKNWWGRRKRSMNYELLQDLELSQEEALSIMKRSWCVSIQDVINGANKALDVFLKPVNDLLSKVLGALPHLSLPGLPDFSALLNFNLNINIPSLDLGINLSVFDIFPKLDFSCAIQIHGLCTAMPPTITGKLCTAPFNGK